MATTSQKKRTQYLSIRVEAATKTGAVRAARKKAEKSWNFVGATPKYKNPDKKLYLWDVSYRRKK